MSEVSGDQFNYLAGRANEKDGGFTFNTKTGGEPAKGIAVAQRGHEERLNMPTTANDMSGYVERHGGELAKPKQHFGFWHPGNAARGVADVSHVMRSDQPKRAMREIVMHKQEAGYHIEAGEDINSPVHPANVSTEGMTHQQAKAHVAATRAAQDVFAEGYRKQRGLPSTRRPGQKQWQFTPRKGQTHQSSPE